MSGGWDEGQDPLGAPAAPLGPRAPRQLRRSAESSRPAPHSQANPPSVFTHVPSQAALWHSLMSRGTQGMVRSGVGTPPGHPLPLGYATPAHRCSGRRWLSRPWRSQRDTRGRPPGSRRGYRTGRSRTLRKFPVVLEHGHGIHRVPMPPQDHPLPILLHGSPRDGDSAEVTRSHSHLHLLGFVAWRGKKVGHGAHRFVGICILWDSWRGEGSASGITTFVSTWAGDSLLSIRAHAKVGSNAGTTTAAEGAECCGNGNRSSGNGNRILRAPQTPVLTQGALPAARGQHPAGTTSAAGAWEADVGPHAAPVGHQSLRSPCPEPPAWSKGPRNARIGAQSERSRCAHVPGSRAQHGSEDSRIRWDREGTATSQPSRTSIPARGDRRSVPRLDRDTGSKTGMRGKG